MGYPFLNKGNAIKVGIAGKKEVSVSKLDWRVMSLISESTGLQSEFQ